MKPPQQKGMLPPVLNYILITTSCPSFNTKIVLRFQHKARALTGLRAQLNIGWLPALTLKQFDKVNAWRCENKNEVNKLDWTW